MLAERVVGDERRQLGHDVGMSPIGEVHVDGLLERVQAQLLEPQDLARRERLVRDVGQRRPAPQPERPTRRALRHQPLESAHIDGLGSDAQLVPAPARDDLHVVARLREKPA
jgi:hypothetical protein